MRKYVLTDRAGVTVTGHTLEPGKFIQATDDKANLVRRVNECGAETPLLAALLSPIPHDQARLFSIHCWNVTIDPKNGQSYTVVKEIEPVPMVTPEQRLRFAVLVAKEACPDRDFRNWSEKWLSGEDTSVKAARDVIGKLQAEANAAANLEDLSAWMESGVDVDETRLQEDGTQRAVHVLQAVDMLDDPERSTSAAMELTQALAGLERLASKLPLASMSELVMDENVPRQAAG